MNKSISVSPLPLDTTNQEPSGKILSGEMHGRIHEYAAYAPVHGWAAFTEHAALLEAVWEGIYEQTGRWHYMNPMSTCSIWESCEDGTAFSIFYENPDGLRLEQLFVQAGQAGAYVAPIIARFDLVVSAE